MPKGNGYPWGILMRIQTVFKQHHHFEKGKMTLNGDILFWIKEKGKWLLLYVEEKVNE